MLGAVAYAVLPTPGVQGPFLGDQFTNVYSLQQAATFMNQMGFASPSNSSTTQVLCVPLTTPTNSVTPGAAGGSFCLPTAIAGRMVVVSNASATLAANIFGSNTPFVAGTQDNINGSPGSGAFSLAANTQTLFVANANGLWGRQ
jgi:hypothetical protein